MTQGPVSGQEQPVARVCYVFAVGRSAEELERVGEGTSGQADAPVRTVEAAGLTALVCDVPEDEFGEEGLKAQLDDLERLEAVARAHHAVVSVAYEHATVLPMRLATVYRDDSRVAEMLHERAAEFHELIAELEGHTEWGVKVYADPQAADSTQQPSDGAAATSPGRAYLQQRRASRRNHQLAYRAAGAVASRIVEAASGLATARVSHRPQQGELASGPGENIANDSYLVPADSGQEFRDTVTVLAAETPGVHVEVTGPWAPYSFATPPQVQVRTVETVEGDGDAG